jgi:hypothetical protein
MKALKLIVLCSAICLGLAGCTTIGAPIVAGAYDTVGLAIGAGTQEQGGNLTLGYKGGKFAIVPVQNAEGDLLALANGADQQKSFSVLAILGLDAKAGLATGAHVDQVVAVGPAAEIWAAGRAPLTPEGVAQLKALGVIR